MAEIGGNVDKVGNFLRKQDPNLKMTLRISKMFIGNYEMKLVPGTMFRIEQNQNRKLSFRFHLEKNPLVGYDAIDIGLAITQIESMSIKEDERENPAIVVLKVQQLPLKKLLTVLHGLKDRLINVPKTDHFVFILKPYEENQDCYCKVYYRNQGYMDLEFEEVIQLFKEYVQPVWMQMNSEQALRRTKIMTTHAVQVVSVMDQLSWVQTLENLKLEKKMDAYGSAYYVPKEENRLHNQKGQKRILHSFTEHDRNERKRGKPADPRLAQLLKQGPLKGARRVLLTTELTKYVNNQSTDEIQCIQVTKKIKKKMKKLAKTMKAVMSHDDFQRNVARREENRAAKQKINYQLIDNIADTFERMEIVPAPPPAQPQPRQVRVVLHQNQTPLNNKQYVFLMEPEVMQRSPIRRTRNPSYPGSGMPPARQNFDLAQAQAQYQEQQQQQEQANYQPYPTQYIPELHHSGYEQMQQVEEQNQQPEQQVAAVNGNGAAEQQMPMEHNQMAMAMEVEAMDDAEMAEFLQPAQTMDQNSNNYDARQQGDHQQQQPPVVAVRPVRRNVPPPKEEPQYVDLDDDDEPAPPPTQRRVNYITDGSPLVVFPPPELVQKGIREQVVVIMKDITTIDRGSYLNDTVMCFMLNYYSVHKIDKTIASKIHFYNTFFYSNLTREIPSGFFSPRRPTDNYYLQKLSTNCHRVQRWTKALDIFTRDYLVIPINEDYHWMLVVVFNPAGAIVDFDDEEKSRSAPVCQIAFFDPMGGLDPQKKQHIGFCVSSYMAFMFQSTRMGNGRYVTGKNEHFEMSRCNVSAPIGLPIQNNLFDCGFYVLYFIEGVFCYDKILTYKDFPDFNWGERYRGATEQAELMRDKVYNVIRKLATPEDRRRLSRYERATNAGLSREGRLRLGRRHSADRVRSKKIRNKNYSPRAYSLAPTCTGSLFETQDFQSPRRMVEMTLTQKIRALRGFELGFCACY